ncbi:diacylglycerol O-acyltransferase [Mycobacterium kubicae]|uniref:Diacylglycerol O-acyltransferase n=1 Tax=Mycobacterium kubicae TaxID=120959 RepID=A0AAX1J5K3_9MYCO|nr:wax ester/triacylglycerol synthase family O-acyltransferase [Mycobacterium kubicae]MCV7094587.1 wax ester/triacylglycerol synthase family O-acyltransferase [Mycobacterium kubicae]ORV97565.1 diacylglycerol O-acyltransferase [Mycobacterium kubicae]QNI12936.1 wax ester/triacylglycerol synthase family O-acyltransferase [Mycobacterium kubicae]QPI36452.1 wax ester/triacylglycerol synthase family O-acyltransferase [Mycobacterium kubicae]GFG67598.1 diacylglycerol O-acyltransferase [Mycobacterium ku
MAEPAEAAGLSDELGPVDYLMHRGEANPRTRSGIMALEVLDSTPDWDRFRTRFENASRRVLRLRQKVVVPTLPTAAPRWVVDPDFNLDFHVRRLRVSGAGTLREVFDLAEVILQSPLDISRPLWTATLVEGLEDGKAATLLHVSHAVTDGVGGVEMFAEIYDLERDPPAKPVAPQPIPRDLTPNDLMRQGLNRLPVALVNSALGALSGAVTVAGRAVLEPASTVSGLVGYAMSSVRVMNRAAEPSPLLRRRSLTSRTEAIDIRLSELHKAAKAGGGSINDAYLAGLCGALRRYHEALGVPISTLPMAVPVNLRADADGAGGNRFTGVNLAAPVGTIDPVSRMKKIRAQMTQRRDEPAMNVVGAMAPVLSVLPTAVLEGISGSVIGSDVQASNVPVYPGDTYIAGAKILRQYGIGPLPGVAMMVVLISRGGWCTITVRYDRASVRNDELFARCLLEGFDEILALAGEPAPRAVPASFAAPTGSASRSVSGS